nr:FGGY-family carbohydrate kinase [Actinomycetota bacterium]
LGISLSTTRAEMVRSVLEGVAYSNRWLYGPVRRFLPAEPTSLGILGGGASSDLWCQMHADILGLPLERVEEPIFANLRGAALVAMVGTGMIGVEDARRAVTVDRTFVPDASLSAVYAANYRVFSKIYARQKPLFADLETARKAAG